MYASRQLTNNLHHGSLPSSILLLLDDYSGFAGCLYFQIDCCQLVLEVGLTTDSDSHESLLFCFILHSCDVCALFVSISTFLVGDPREHLVGSKWVVALLIDGLFCILSVIIHVIRECMYAYVLVIISYHSYKKALASNY